MAAVPTELELTVRLSGLSVDALRNVIATCGRFRAAVESGSTLSMLTAIDEIERAIQRLAFLSGKDLLEIKTEGNHGRYKEGC